MKISRVRHVIITSLIFLAIIGVIVWGYGKKLEAIEAESKELVYRVIATQDIEPNTQINNWNAKRVAVPNVVETKELVYRENKDDRIWEQVAITEEYVDQFTNAKTQDKKQEIYNNYKTPTDDRWAFGKIALTKIHKGEMIVASDLGEAETMAIDNQRIYSIAFDSAATGGYNVDVNDKVDICLLYNASDKNIGTYQNLEKNKAIDIVLAKKQIVDIRDEAGNSKKNNQGVVPGYICFKLSYDEINKIEIAKRQGKVFVGITDAYLSDPHEETFMTGEEFPVFEIVEETSDNP